jgi:hypothetical protein
MKEMINRIEERLGRVRNADVFKRELLSFSRVIVESFDLDMCTVRFDESNPILSPFAVSFPPVDHEKVGINQIDEIESFQAKDPKRSVLIPIKHKTNRIGSIILVKKSETSSKEIDINRLNLSAAKISEMIKKIIGLEIKVRLALIIQRLISYKKKIGGGHEKSHRIILDLLSLIVSPTRVYIAAQTDDGSYIFYHVSSKDGKRVDISHGAFMETQLESFVIEIKKNESWTAEIDLKDRGRVKGKLMVKYEKCGSFVDDDIQKILKAIGYNFARLVIFNYFEKSGPTRSDGEYKKD